MLKIDKRVEQLIEQALEEDLNRQGDLTSRFIVSPEKQGEAKILAKEAGIIAGLDVAEAVFKKLDKNMEFHKLIQEGQVVGPGDTVAQIQGKLQALLAAERTALNFLQRLSGIATLTHQFVERVKGTRAKILDTRKTTPGWRRLEKYAVRVGGGENHRLGLYDMILIKENHIVASGGITAAVNLVRKGLQAMNLNLKIEVETRTIPEVEEALLAKVDRIMLDNMNLKQIREAVNIVKGAVELEVSGGVSLETVGEIASTGVDYISVGALTHSAKALDLSLLVDS